MDPTGGGIIMIGSQGDRVEFADGAEWRMAEPIDVAGFSFSQVTLGDTFVQVDFASAWQNLAQPSDVNNDGNVTSGDALRIINELSRRAFSDPVTAEVKNPSSVSPWPNLYFDQSGDRLATALDALRVINQLARQQNGSGSGEGELALAVFGPTFETTPQFDVTRPATNTMEPEGETRKPSVAGFAANAEHFASSERAITELQVGLVKTEPTAVAAGPEATVNQDVRPEASATAQRKVHFHQPSLRLAASRPQRVLISCSPIAPLSKNSTTMSDEFPRRSYLRQNVVLRKWLPRFIHFLAAAATPAPYLFAGFCFCLFL